MTSVCADLMQRDRVLDRGDGGDLIYPCSGCFCCFLAQLLGPRLLLFFVVCATFVIVFRCLGCSCCFFVVSAFFSLFRLLLFYDLRPIWCLKMLQKKKDTSCSF